MAEWFRDWQGGFRHHCRREHSLEIKIRVHKAVALNVVFRSEQNWYWVRAYKDHDIIGCVGVRNDGFIHDLYVNEEFRNNYIGTRLLEKAGEVVPNDLQFRYDDTPIEFYKKVGFEQIAGKLIRRSLNTADPQEELKTPETGEKV